jgi:hypothetical protein
LQNVLVSAPCVRAIGSVLDGITRRRIPLWQTDSLRSLEPILAVGDAILSVAWKSAVYTRYGDDWKLIGCGKILRHVPVLQHACGQLYMPDPSGLSFSGNHSNRLEPFPRILAQSPQCLSQLVCFNMPDSPWNGTTFSIPGTAMMGN